MVKKNKNRQTQESPTMQNGGDSAESGDQKKSCSSGCRCPHIQKAIQLASIKKGVKTGVLAGDCPGCIKDGVKPEQEEGTPNPGLWLCLQCGHQGCGRTQNQHALKHFHVVHSDPHCIAVNTTSWNVWCYSCEVELPSEYRKKLQECVKYLKNLDCPPSVRGTAKSGQSEESKETEIQGSPPMPLADVTNMPHGNRAPKKKMVTLPRVRGLHNLGNTCFFNSVMQCLAQTPHFLELLQDTRQGGARFCLHGGKGLLQKSEGKRKDEEEEEEEDEDDDELPPLEGTLTKWGTLTETLAFTLEELRQDDATAVNPQRLFNKLTSKFPQFGGGDQHDAHELLRHLLDEVRTEDLKRYWIAILDQYGLSRHDTSETVDSSVRARVRAYGRQAGDLSLLPDPVFRGILVSTVECQDCLHSYQRTEPFYELSLPVTTNKPQPPIMRRKAGGEESSSFDVCGNTVANETPSKHQLKKERRLQRKGRKKERQQQKSSRVVDVSAGEPVITEEANNSAESEQSDADVEDNIEQEGSLLEGRNVDLLVNGEIVSPISSKLCNGNLSDNESIEESRSMEKQCDKIQTICNGDALSPVKLSKGKRLAAERRDRIKENGTEIDIVKNDIVIAMPWKENGDIGNSTKESKHSDEDLETSEKTYSPKKTINFKENEIQNKCVFVENKRVNCIDGQVRKEKDNVIGNGISEISMIEENGNVINGMHEIKRMGSNCIYEGTCAENESVELMDTSTDLSFTKDTPSKDVPHEEFSLSISASVNSPSALGSPISNTGSPSSESSDLNVELIAPNNWILEDSDRPYSRIAFCNDNDLVNSNNDKQITEATADYSFCNSVPKTPENSREEIPSADQLAKEMAGLSLGHEECQSPSHWDTCSAHSLDDLKETKFALPLDVPLCSGIGAGNDPDSAGDSDKTGTLAPRYHCEDKECSIESCLNQFTMLELMTGSCKVICESCSERINKGKEGKMIATNSTKQYLVSNPPAVLVLHLKRFEVFQNMFRKTPRHVTFPMLLDIAPICNTKCRELPTIRKGQTKVLYSLYGVVQHSGTLHGGHYSAYVKVRAPVRRDDLRWCFLPTAQSSQKLEEMSKGLSIPTEPIPGKWYHVSDSRVNEVNEDRVLHSQAYLLFYERIW